MTMLECAKNMGHNFCLFGFQVTESEQICPGKRLCCCVVAGQGQQTAHNQHLALDVADTSYFPCDGH